MNELDKAEYPYEPVATGDGSWTCRDPITGELYHNSAGAYEEALKNYVEPLNLPALLAKRKDITILDPTYGLGYNTWVLLNEWVQVAEPDSTLSVVAVDLDPKIFQMTPLILQSPTFDPLKLKTTPLEHNVYYRTHWDPGASTISVEENRQIHLDFRVGDLRQIVPQLTLDLDAVFHDAFSPAKVPELWTVDLFQEYARLLKKRQGKVLTYSAAAAVRGGLRDAAFRLFRTAAVGRKGGGTLATMSLDEIGPSPLPSEELALLATRAGIPYSDPSFSGTTTEVINNRTLAQEASSLPTGSSVRQTFD